MADGTKQRKWVIALGHRDYPEARIDLSEFALGAPDKRTGKSKSAWSGGFTGRPGLIGDLWSALKVAWHGKTPKQALGVVTALRSFWRYLDAREAYFSNLGIENRRVEHLHHLTGLAFDAWLQPGPGGAWARPDAGLGRGQRTARWAGPRPAP